MIGSFNGDGGSFFFCGAEEVEAYNHLTTKMTNKTKGRITEKSNEYIFMEID